MLLGKHGSFGLFCYSNFLFQLWANPYFYTQQLNSPCGSVVFAYHTQAEVNDPNSTGYTAGRILLDVTDSSGTSNVDPNASNLKYTLTLDVGGNLTGQEYVVTY